MLKAMTRLMSRAPLYLKVMAPVRRCPGEGVLAEGANHSFSFLFEYQANVDLAAKCHSMRNHF